MNHGLLSFSNISLNELQSNNVVEKVNKFITDIQELLIHIMSSKNIDPDNLTKFKSLIDTINLYNNGKLLNVLQNSQHDIIFNDFDQLTTSSDSDSNSEIVLEDEYQDIFEQFIDTEYSNIEKNSVLKKNINIKRDDAVSFG